MKNIKIISVVLFLNFNMSLFAQTYMSPQQKTTTNGFANRVETKLLKKVVIEDTSFNIELPEGGQLSGVMELFNTIERSDDKRTIYYIEGGGVLTIYDDLVDNNWDCIIINLLATTNKKVYTFWLTEGNKGDD